MATGTADRAALAGAAQRVAAAVVGKIGSRGGGDGPVALCISYRPWLTGAAL